MIDNNPGKGKPDLPDDLHSETSSHDLVISVDEEPGDTTVRPLRPYLRKLFEQQGILPPQPPPRPAEG